MQSHSQKSEFKQKPFSRRRLYEQIVDEIGTRITRGQYAPGDILPNEETLVDELGVSRTVIREAVKVLTEKGLVKPRPKIGTMVLPRKSWSLLDSDVLNWALQTGQQQALLHKVTEARRIIEPEAAALAAQRATDEQLERMASALHDMAEAAEEFELNAEQHIEADLIFHATILEACGNELLEQMANMMRRALIVSREVTTHIPGKAAASIPAHRAVLKAIQQRDHQEAHRAMLALIDMAKADIEEAYMNLNGERNQNHDRKGSL